MRCTPAIIALLLTAAVVPGIAAADDSDLCAKYSDGTISFQYCVDRPEGPREILDDVLEEAGGLLEPVDELVMCMRQTTECELYVFVAGAVQCVADWLQDEDCTLPE